MTRHAADPAMAITMALTRLAGDLPALGLAVSGGGDSMALMHIATRWANGRRLMVATVDHGLRPESASEARQVGRAAHALGLHHATLTWVRDTETGNLMANARDARLRLLAGWATRNDLPVIALGHTADDQAETLLMRLARGSGIDGLASMAEWRDRFDVRWLRPMLGVGRASLRNWLRAQDIPWIDDPSNDDPDYERIRIRQALLATGLDVAALARAATHIGEARDALSHYASRAARDAQIANATVILPRHDLGDAPPEIRRRLLVAACRWITGADYPPRRTTALHALEAVAAGIRVTLDGALIETSGDRIRISREPAAAARASCSTGQDWDNRWRIEGLAPGQHVMALGLDHLPQTTWRLSGLGRQEAAASPAVWQDKRLIAAPLLRFGPGPSDCGCRVSPLRNAADFRRLVMAH